MSKPVVYIYISLSLYIYIFGLQGGQWPPKMVYYRELLEIQLKKIRFVKDFNPPTYIRNGYWWDLYIIIHNRWIRVWGPWGPHSIGFLRQFFVKTQDFPGHFERSTFRVNVKHPFSEQHIPKKARLCLVFLGETSEHGNHPPKKSWMVPKIGAWEQYYWIGAWESTHTLFFSVPKSNIHRGFQLGSFSQLPKVKSLRLDRKKNERLMWESPGISEGKLRGQQGKDWKS